MSSNHQTTKRESTLKKQVDSPDLQTQMVQLQASPEMLMRQAQLAPTSLTPNNILQLQRLVGNQAVGQLLGRDKSASTTMVQRDGLQVGPSNDRYEQEADGMADYIMKTPSNQAPTPSRVQREQQESQVQREEDEEIQMKPISTIQRDGGGAGFAVDNKFRDEMKSSGGGKPLPSDIQAEFGSKMGSDLSGVRVHTDNKAAGLSQQIQAKAFTHKNHIYMGEGQYKPNTIQGKRLLAHEATHTVQQTGGGAIQRKASNLSLLPKSIVRWQLVGKSTTGKIQDKIKKYNAISEDDTNYLNQKKILQQIFQLTNSWKARYSGGKNQKTNKMPHIEQLEVEANTEYNAVDSQTGDVSDPTPVLSSLGTGLGHAGDFLGGKVAKPAGNFFRNQFGKIDKFSLAYTKLNNDEKQMVTGTLGLYAGTTKSAIKLEKLYKKNKTMLTSSQMLAITKLSNSNNGRNYLNAVGFVPQNQAYAYAMGRNFKNWENEKAGKKLQVTRLQYEQNLTNTPGYFKAMSILGNTDEVHERDRQVWEDTLSTPDFTDDSLKQALASDNRTTTTKSGRKLDGHLGDIQTLQQRHAAATKILQRIFLVLQKGLTQRKSKDEDYFSKWEGSVAIALSHGGRVNIRIPKVDVDDDPNTFFNWLFGSEQDRETAGMHTRSAGTHFASVEKDEQVSGGRTLRGRFKEKGGMGAAVKAKFKGFQHFGLDLPVGGLGQQDMTGKVILPNGSYGHLYIGYTPPTTRKDGALLIGCETDAPGKTNPLGHKHTAAATSAEMGPTMVHKSDRVGVKKGGMMVDLSAISKIENDWLTQLRDMEGEVNRGNIEARDLVGEQGGIFDTDLDRVVTSSRQDSELRQQVEEERLEQMMEALEEAGML